MSKAAVGGPRISAFDTGLTNLRVKKEVWQPSFLDRRIRDSLEYQKFKDYIWQNPAKRLLAKTPEEYPHSSVNPCFQLDPAPQRLKPISSAELYRRTEVLLRPVVRETFAAPAPPPPCEDAVNWDKHKCLLHLVRVAKPLAMGRWVWTALTAPPRKEMS
jgi:hypothetical protein